MYQLEGFKKYNNIQISMYPRQIFEMQATYNFHFLQVNLNINAIINKNLQQTKFVILLLQNSFV